MKYAEFEAALSERARLHASIDGLFGARWWLDYLNVVNLGLSSGDEVSITCRRWTSDGGEAGSSYVDSLETWQLKVYCWLEVCVREWVCGRELPPPVPRPSWEHMGSKWQTVWPDGVNPWIAASSPNSDWNV